MAKLDFERERRKRLPRDVCADAPWRSAVPSIAPQGPQPVREPERRSAPQPSPASDDLASRLRSIAMSLAGPDFANLPPATRLEELAKIQARLTRIVDIHGSSIRSTQAFRLAEGACTQEAKALRRLSRRG